MEGKFRQDDGPDIKQAPYSIRIIFEMCSAGPESSCGRQNNLKTALLGTIYGTIDAAIPARHREGLHVANPHAGLETLVFGKILVVAILAGRRDHGTSLWFCAANESAEISKFNIFIYDYIQKMCHYVTNCQTQLFTGRYRLRRGSNSV